jgi:hypothetical protein
MIRPPLAGQVLGTEDATPLGFWVAVHRDAYLQLDDVVLVHTHLPDGTVVTLYGVVDLVRARHEGTQFDSDVFLVTQGLLPAATSLAAHVAVTRVEPEIFVPPRPGDEVHLAAAGEATARDLALFFDRMERRLPLGLGRDDLPVHANLEFLDGARGAHVNISGISGVATKTTYATFLLYNLFHSDALGVASTNARAFVFNVKGEDLLFLDRPNTRLDAEARAQYAALGLPAGPFRSVTIYAPVRPHATATVPDTGARQEGVTAYYWTLREFALEKHMSFLFADADAELELLPSLIRRIEARLAREAAAAGGPDDAWIQIEGERVNTFAQLVDRVRALCEDKTAGPAWVGSAASGTVSAFIRRLENSVASVGHLIRAAGAERPAAHRIDPGRAQISVVDIHSLRDHAQRFVVGVVLKRMLDDKERSGTRDPLTFVLLDELNKYAPREGWSPIKEIVLDIAERGRSLGIVLLGAQQTASEVERRVIVNSALRVVGRLDAAEAGREEYGFLPASARQRSTILKPGTMIVLQPEIPIPLLVRFPFPAWATRHGEAPPAVTAAELEDTYGRIEG